MFHMNLSLFLPRSNVGVVRAGAGFGGGLIDSGELYTGTGENEPGNRDCCGSGREL